MSSCKRIHSNSVYVHKSNMSTSITSEDQVQLKLWNLEHRQNKNKKERTQLHQINQNSCSKLTSHADAYSTSHDHDQDDKRLNISLEEASYTEEYHVRLAFDSWVLQMLLFHQVLLYCMFNEYG